MAQSCITHAPAPTRDAITWAGVFLLCVCPTRSAESAALGAITCRDDAFAVKRATCLICLRLCCQRSCSASTLLHQQRPRHRLHVPAASHSALCQTRQSAGARYGSLCQAAEHVQHGWLRRDSNRAVITCMHVIFSDHATNKPYLSAGSWQKIGCGVRIPGQHHDLLCTQGICTRVIACGETVIEWCSLVSTSPNSSPQHFPQAMSGATHTTGCQGCSAYRKQPDSLRLGTATPTAHPDGLRRRRRCARRDSCPAVPAAARGLTTGQIVRSVVLPQLLLPAPAAGWWCALLPTGAMQV